MTFLSTLLLSALAMTTPHADFSGTWSINIAASELSDRRVVAPDRLVMTVRQKGESLWYGIEREKSGKKAHSEVDLTIGAPSFESDPESVATAAWKGDALEIKLAHQTSTWTLSADRKQLLDDSVIRQPRIDGEIHIRRVFDRQP